MQDDNDELLRLARQLYLERDQGAPPLRWRPAADLYRTRGGWVIKVELAGVEAHQIELAARGQVLVLRGHRRDNAFAEDCAFYTMEILYSEFERTFQLPIDLERCRITTECTNGMLLIRITPEVTSP
jgi:HSP20 family protein